jgi:lysosomal-associated membrane protein 1/2
MKLCVAIILCWTVLLVSGTSNTTSSTKLEYEPEPNPTKKPPTTIEPTDIPTTSTSTTTTTLKPTTTTTNSTTTTTATTTTEKPTTTTTTTTEKPTTTTTVKPSPAPAPEPQTGSWYINGSKAICIAVKMAVKFNVTYLTNDNVTLSQQIILPNENMTTALGVCEDKEQNITISWKGPGVISGMNSLILHFVKNDEKYSLHHIEVSIVSDELPKFNSSAAVVLIHNTSEYRTDMGLSFKCLRQQNLKMESNSTALPTGSLEITNLQFQAFRNDKTRTFGFPQDCAMDTQDFVPIAVGCALIALVIIVLVAYLVGRRRSQARGYLSM